MPTWIREVQAISTPFVALGAAAIAFFAAWVNRRQAHTARQKLRLDLFHLRYAIYSTTVDVVVAALNMRDDEPMFVASTRDLHLKVREARFLFDEDFFLFLDGVETRVLQHRHWSQVVRRRMDIPDGQYQSYLDTYNEGQQFLIESLKTLAIKAKPFLQIEETASFSVRRSNAGVEPSTADQNGVQP